jgi:formamidopyrimidine-DNA glycosylase
MPELPEVETIVRGLKPMLGLAINNIKINTPKLRFLIPKNILKLKRDIKIKEIERRGKYIKINLNNKSSIIIHLGMSGRLRLFDQNKFIFKKHDHLIINLEQNLILVFNDPRRFGFVDYDKSHKISQKKYILNLGIEALSYKLTGNYMHTRINKTIVPIKQILLDQRIIAGIGNIYASEILFDAQISPFKKGKDLSLLNCKKLIFSTKKILRKAINSGGSTLKNYVSTDGTLGNFQNNFKVYNQDGLKISGQIIKKTVQYGRSTYYCPGLQKR